MNLFLLNPQSERANLLKKRIKKYLVDLKISGDFIEVGKVEDLNGIIKKAIDDKVDRVISIGGDGMINRLIPLIVKTDITLCIIPVGETNFFANIIGIKNWKDGCKNLIQGKETEINLGKVNEKYFLSSVEIDPKKEDPIKTPRLNILKKKKNEKTIPVSINIQSDNNTLKLHAECYSILISTMPISPHRLLDFEEDPEKDNLNIIIRSKNTKKNGSKKEITVLQGRLIDIQTKTPMNINVDGDSFGKTPAIIEKTNNHLKLLKYSPIKK